MVGDSIYIMYEYTRKYDMSLANITVVFFFSIPLSFKIGRHFVWRVGLGARQSLW